MVVHNGERYLREALDSVLEQTLGDWQLLVVDDGSTDATSSILDNYARCDSRIMIERQPFQGQIKALVRGLALVGGDYVARLDADDVMLPERLARQVEFMDRHPEVGLVGSAAELIDEHSRPFGRIRPPAEDAALRRVLIQRNPFIHSSVFIRRSVLSLVGVYDSNLRDTEDYDLWLRIAQAARLAILPIVLVKLRKHSQNASYMHNKRQVRGHLDAQWRALARGQYPPWNVAYCLRSLALLLAPVALLRLRGRSRRASYKRAYEQPF